MKISQISNYIFEELLPLNPQIQTDQLQKKVAEKINLTIDLPEMSDEVLTQAFTHKSFAHEVKHICDLGHNEILEFLGDAVLDLIVSEKLIKDHPLMSEGQLSKFRSSIVNENTLSQLALGLNMNEVILVGKGEIKAQGFLKRSLLSDTFEALIGAIYTSQGLEMTKEFFMQINEILEIDVWDKTNLEKFDAKTKLQEYVMKKYNSLPVYECLEIENNQFEITCYINDESLGKVISRSKKKGMQELAFQILNQHPSLKQE